MIFECVVNVSEGRDDAVLGRLADAAGPALLDLHRDPDHHRSVLTLAGPADAVAAAVRALAAESVARLDLRDHAGAHPRLGVLDVVPFVPYEPGRPAPEDLAPAVALRDAFAHWLGAELGVPSFLYGPLPGGRARSLPDVRRRAFAAVSGGLTPDFGPAQADPRTGATAVGARRVLVAYNVWVSSAEVARRVAPLVRRPEVRALGLAVGDRAQVSCNLFEPAPLRARTASTTRWRRASGSRAASPKAASWWGSCPSWCWPPCPRHRWRELGLSGEQTVESRLAAGAGVPKRPDTSGVFVQEALATSRRARARARRRRRRSRSLMPPQMPNFSPLANAYSRQSSRTTQPRQTSLASRVEAPRSGKNRSGSTPMQLACSCQLRSWRP